MKAGSMDALIGASTNIKIAAVPVKVYKEAKNKGDTDTMERAMGYAADFSKKALDYSEKAKDALAEELKEEREENEVKCEEAIEKRREQEKILDEKLSGSDSSNKVTNNDSVEITSGKESSEQTVQTNEIIIPSENAPIEVYTEKAETTSLQHTSPSFDIIC